MKTNIVELSKAKVTEILKPLKKAGFAYHNLKHTLKVCQFAEELIAQQDLSDDQKLEIRLAALFHDTGVVNGIADHEESSKTIAKAFLADKVSSEVLQNVLDLIGATVYGTKASNISESIIQDADLYNLGHKSYFKVLDKLFRERNAIGTPVTKEEFKLQVIGFITNHQFNTQYARDTWQLRKDKNIKQLKKGKVYHQDEKQTKKKSKKKAKSN